MVSSFRFGGGMGSRPRRTHSRLGGAAVVTGSGEDAPKLHGLSGPRRFTPLSTSQGGSLSAAHEGSGPDEVRPARSGPDLRSGEPATKDNELLVRVHATTVNRTDCACRAARPFFMRFFTGLIRPRARVLGNEFAGVVQAVGSGVTSFEVGDKVFGYNEGPFGAHAEYMSIPEDDSLATMPANVTYQEAAPSTEGSHYALSHTRAA